MFDPISAFRAVQDLRAIALSQAVIWFTPEGRIIDANDNFCLAMGYAREEIIGKQHRIFCDETVASSGEYNEFWKQLRDGKFSRGEFRRISKSGNDVWIEATYNPVFSGNKVVRIVKIATDITDRKEAALLDEQRLAAIGNSQAIIEFSLNGTILNANRNFLDTMGYTLSEIAGKHHSMFCDATYAQSPDYHEFWEALRNGEFFSETFVRFGKGGKKIWIQASYTPVRNRKGHVERVIKVASDITARMRSAERISEAIRKLAAGDLTTQIGTGLDEALEQTRIDFNAAVNSLNDVMETIIATAGTLMGNTKVIERASAGIAQSAERQAASIEETASALEEMTTTVKDASARAAEVGQLVGDTRRDAEASGVIVNDATLAMEDIEKSSGQISNIIGTIDEIAFQTNLLALNAGVEAARAGDAGKGFAVVAQEVRELAQRSANAAKEIKGLINTSNNAVKHGVTLVNQTAVSLTKIVERMRDIDANVRVISTSATEQASGIGEINRAIAVLDQGTQHSAATVEEANAASSALSSEAVALNALIAGFRVRSEIAGNKGHVAAA